MKLLLAIGWKATDRPFHLSAFNVRDGTDAAGDPGGAAMKVTGIDHLNLQVSGLDRALRFYCEVLGMEKAFEERPVAVFVKAGTDLLTLAQTRSPIRPEGFHFGFLVGSADEMAQWAQWLAEHGIEIEDRRVEPAGGGIYFRDPDGYLVEIYYER